MAASRARRGRLREPQHRADPTDRCLKLGRLQRHLTEQSIELEVTGAAKDLLTKEGHDRVFGLRPLRRVIRSRIEDQLSELLLRGKIARGDSMVVDVSPEGGFTFEAKPRGKETASEDSRPPQGALA